LNLFFLCGAPYTEAADVLQLKKETGLLLPISHCIDLCYLCGGPCGLKKFFSCGGKTGCLCGGEELCSRGETPESNWNVSEMVEGAAPGKTSCAPKTAIM